MYCPGLQIGPGGYHQGKHDNHNYCNGNGEMQCMWTYRPLVLLSDMCK